MRPLRAYPRRDHRRRPAPADRTGLAREHPGTTGAHGAQCTAVRGIAGDHGRNAAACHAGKCTPKPTAAQPAGTRGHSRGHAPVRQQSKQGCRPAWHAPLYSLAQAQESVSRYVLPRAFRGTGKCPGGLSCAGGRTAERAAQRMQRPRNARVCPLQAVFTPAAIAASADPGQRQCPAPTCHCHPAVPPKRRCTDNALTRLDPRYN